MEFKRIKIDPELAEAILRTKGNPKNRQISRATVEAYARDMRDGNWDEDAYSPIVFDKEGILMDGHHRLNAIIKAETPIMMYVVTDAEKSSTYDLNRPRTYNNILTIDGVSKELCSTNVVSLVRSIGLFCFGVGKVSIGEVRKAIDIDGKTLYEIYLISKRGSKRGFLGKAPYTTALYIAHKCGVSKDVIQEFCEIANTGIMNETWQTAPIILRNNCTELNHRQDRFLAFKTTQEAIYDFSNKVVRKTRYLGKTSRYDSIFVDAFRRGELFR